MIKKQAYLFVAMSISIVTIVQSQQLSIAHVTKEEAARLGSQLLAAVINKKPLVISELIRA